MTTKPNRNRRLVFVRDGLGYLRAAAACAVARTPPRRGRIKRLVVVREKEVRHGAGCSAGCIPRRRISGSAVQACCCRADCPDPDAAGDRADYYPGPDAVRQAVAPASAGLSSAYLA